SGIEANSRMRDSRTQLRHHPARAGPAAPLCAVDARSAFRCSSFAVAEISLVGGKPVEQEACVYRALRWEQLLCRDRGQSVLLREAGCCERRSVGMMCRCARSRTNAPQGVVQGGFVLTACPEERMEIAAMPVGGTFQRSGKVAILCDGQPVPLQPRGIKARPLKRRWRLNRLIRFNCLCGA